MSTPSLPSLEDLERVASAAHASATKCVGGMLEHGMRAGDILIDIMRRKLVAHGDKKRLFERTCGSQRAGQLYVQLAENRSRITAAANANRDSHLSIADALRLIRKPKPKDSDKPDKPLKSLSRWTNDELSEALNVLGPDRLLQAAAPAFRHQLGTRIAGQANRLIAQAAAANPKLKAKDLPPLKLVVANDSPREAQAQALQDVGSDSRSEAERLQVSLDEKSRELRLLQMQNSRLERDLEEQTPAKLIEALERSIPRSNLAAHKHLQQLKAAINQPTTTGTREVVLH
jgi:hypothetical protein